MLYVIMYFIMVISFIGMLIGLLAWQIIDSIKMANKRKQDELNKVRRNQLIKEMKVGTFDEKKVDSMIKELGELMKGTYYVKYSCIMERNNVGFWTLKTLKTDNHSWI